MIKEILGFILYFVFVCFVTYFWIIKLDPNNKDGDDKMEQCPFCGSTAVLYENDNEVYVCGNCNQEFNKKS